jgi:transmembrane sensor
MTDDERLGPPPVEPMSDVSWSRVERGLWARLDAAETTSTTVRTLPASRRWWLVAGPLVAAAATLAIVVGTRTSPKNIAVIDEPARVLSGSAPSSVSFGDAHLELDAHTAVVMNHENGQPIVLLERGAAWFTVAPRLQRPEFVVRAGDAMVRVVGTRFRVARSEERISVDVERGLVDVQFRGGVVKVAASQRWSSESPVAVSAIAGTPSPVGPIAATEPATEPMAAPVPALDPPAAGPVRTPSHRAEPKAGPRIEPKPAPRAPSAPEETQAGDRDRAEYERLAALEPKTPAAALDGYLALARGTSRWADLALYAAARLAADHHDRRAEALLGIYLQRFPKGANAADARQLLAHVRGDHP